MPLHSKFKPFLNLFLTLLLFGSSTQLYTQTSGQEQFRIFKTNELKEDFRILRNSLEKSHAGLYAYTSKKIMEEAFGKIEAKLNEPMTSIDFFRTISPLLKLIGNGHTDFRPPPDFRTAINSALPRFPFAVYWNADTLFVLRNLSANENIAPGTIIKSINGETAADIVRELADNLTRDGQNTTWPEAKVNADFSGYYAFYKGTPELFDLELLIDGQVQEVKIKGLTNSEIIKKFSKRYKQKKRHLLSSENLPLNFKLENGIGILTIKNFDKPSIKKQGESYKKYFKELFAYLKIKQPEHLILDIRNNGGGWPEVVTELFRYLSDTSIIGKTTSYTITNKIPNRKHYQYGFWEFLELRISLRPKKQGDKYIINKGSTIELHQPYKNNYTGALYILVNPFSFSATTSLMGMLKDADRGVIIGEIAGGSPHQVTAWLMPTLILPNTKIEAIIPLVQMKTERNFKDTRTGIAPDHFVKNSMDDMLKERDAVMEYTLDMIGRDNEKL